MSSVSVGVIGAGTIGRQHARIYAAMPDVDLVAIADPDYEQSSNIADRLGCRWYPSHMKLLEQEDLDAVSIAVPTGLHWAVGKDVIEADIALLVEKPLAETPADARLLVELAKERDVLMTVGHVERFNPVVRSLRKIIQDGTLGKIISVTTRRVGVLPPSRYQTHVTIDLAVHDIDVLHFLLGERPHLRGVMSGSAYGTGYRDWADLSLACGEVSCFVQVNWVTPIKVRKLTITGTNGYAELDYIAQELTVYESPAADDFKDFEDFVRQYGRPPRHYVPVEPAEPLREELAAFINSVRHGTPLEVTGDDGLIAVEIAHEALRLSLEKA